MHGTVVGVLRGGPSREHDVSLKTGAAIVASLPTDRYTTRDIYIDRQGTWHDHGRPVSPVRALQAVDAVLIGLHGEYGEDGGVQKLLEQLGIRYAGSDSFGSFLAMHKFLAKQKAKEAGLLVARDYFVENIEDAERGAHEATRSFSQPVVIKPVAWGSSVGVSVVSGYLPIYEAIQALFEGGARGVLIEERIKGIEATAGVVEGLRDETLYALPPIEIIPPEFAGYFAAHVKYTGETKEICPGRFPRSTHEELMQAAKTMHEALGLKHYSRSDFIVSPKGVYYLETNTLPGMTSESLLPKSLAAVGVSFPDFLSHLVELALQKK
ncbi:MAG: D-alanine--D-alanine ligase [Minisyncoccia bacterium]